MEINNLYNAAKPIKLQNGKKSICVIMNQKQIMQAQSYLEVEVCTFLYLHTKCTYTCTYNTPTEEKLQNLAKGHQRDLNIEKAV